MSTLLIPDTVRDMPLQPSMPGGSLVELTSHELANLFPPMGGEEFAQLVADIKVNGLRLPIVLMGNKILDGRNRYRACKEAGVPVRTEQYDGTEPLEFVLSANLHRRHLNESQRAMIAARLANMPAHRSLRDKSANLQTSQPDAAAKLHVSPRSVADAKKVRDTGSAVLVKRVESGEVAVSVAAKIAKMPAADQAKIDTLAEPALRGAVKKAERAKRESDLGDATRAASESIGRKLYPVIYADPPWRFEPYSRDTGMDRAADNHYPTMAGDNLAALELPAADDCVLFLWATVPMEREAHRTMEAWGFTYKSQFIWVKDHAGTGYWNRNQHEILLIGTRGNVPAPAPGEQYPSTIEAPVTTHSTKPDAFAGMIEKMFPTLRGLRCSPARSARDGTAGATKPPKDLARSPLDKAAHRFTRADRRPFRPDTKPA